MAHAPKTGDVLRSHSYFPLEEAPANENGVDQPELVGAPEPVDAVEYAATLAQLEATIQGESPDDESQPETA